MQISRETLLFGVLCAVILAALPFVAVRAAVAEPADFTMNGVKYIVITEDNARALVGVIEAQSAKIREQRDQLERGGCV